jgi:nicotinamidase-related amidase
MIEEGRPFGGARPLIDERGVLPRVAKVLAAAREHGVLVLHARVVFPAGYPDIDREIPLLAIVVQQKALLDGSEGVEIVKDIAATKDDIVFDHVGTSAFVGGRLDQILEEHDINTVVLFGVATNVIVDGTARDAVNRGLRAVVVEDCCAAADQNTHLATLATLGLIIHGVVAGDEFLTQLRAATASERTGTHGRRTQL